MSIIHRYRRTSAAAVVGLALFSAQCGEVARTGRSPVQLTIVSLTATRGGTDEEGNILYSDVQTVADDVPTVFSDTATATFQLVLKNPGVPTAPLGPSSLNQVTISRYRVRFMRTDGRNTPGVDVPYGFDGAFTITVPQNGTAAASFDLVRHQHKLEPPLRNMIGSGGAIFISTIAEITFYGQDLAGNEVTATGSLNVHFGDFGDPGT